MKEELIGQMAASEQMARQLSAEYELRLRETQQEVRTAPAPATSWQLVGLGGSTKGGGGNELVCIHPLPSFPSCRCLLPPHLSLPMSLLPLLAARPPVAPYVPLAVASCPPTCRSRFVRYLPGSAR